MKKKLLAILGGPHENGMTAAMLACAVKAAEANGYETSFISLYKRNIHYCTGCLSCMQTGRCVLKDDIQEIAELLKTCDRVVLAAPTYWANVPAVVKNMFDRLFGTVMEETKTFPRPRLSQKQEYLLLTSCNTPYPFCHIFGQSKGSLHAMHEFFKTSGMKKLGSVVCANVKTKSSLPVNISLKIERFFNEK